MLGLINMSGHLRNIKLRVITPDVFSDPDTDGVCQLYYDEDRNYMLDVGGFPVVNLFSIITPNMYLLFKAKKEYMLIKGIHGGLVELFPDQN